MRLTPFLIGTACAAVVDPCTRLCHIDGPTVCTGGSWSKNGVCHSYVYRGDPALGDYCYHTAATASTCPGSGRSVKVVDVERLIERKTSLRSTAAPPAQIVSTSTAPPSETMDGQSLQDRFVALISEVTARLTENQEFEPPSFSVNRESALIDSLAFLNGPVKPFAGRIISVTFTGEPGYGLGQQKEWMVEITRQLFSPESGFFVLSETAPLYYQISPAGLTRPRAKDVYKATGRLLALSLLRNHPLGVNLPIMFYGKLLDKELTLEEVSAEEPLLVQSLRFLLTLPDGDLANYPITIDGVDLVPTRQNRHQLVQRKINSLISSDVIPMFNLIKQGFSEIFPSPITRALMTAADIKSLILGEPEIDIDDFFANSQINLRDEHQLTLLRKVLTGFTQKQRRNFLRFLTNLTQTPIGGFASIKPQVRVYGMHVDAKEGELPWVYLCFNSMYIHSYGSEKQMRDALLVAIESGSGWK